MAANAVSRIYIRWKWIKHLFLPISEEFAIKIIKTARKIQKRSEMLREEGGVIAFVPTMGFLHEGHIALLKEGRRLGSDLVLSIFVNPTQFGPGEDYASYPRNVEKDLDLARKEGVDVVFTPTKEELYEDRFQTYVTLEGLPNHLCGLDRPVHFRGVTTVVTKLFNIVLPDKAYFGWKDAQQAIIIRKMVQDLNFDIEIRVLPIVREKDGLALSSRNIYLSDDERQNALRIPKAIEMAKDFYRAGGQDGKQLLQELRNQFKGVAGVEIDYIALVGMDDLEERSVLEPGTMLALAVKVGKTRLIDNYRFTEDRSCSD